MSVSRIWVWSHTTTPTHPPKDVKVPPIHKIYEVLGAFTFTYVDKNHCILTVGSYNVTGKSFNHCLQLYQQQLNHKIMGLYVKD